MKVREATDQDAVSILYLCEAFWRETPHFKEVMFDQEKTMRFILQHILDDQSTAFVLDNDDGEVAGMMLASVNSYPFSHETTVNDDAFYILPNSRGKGVLRLLMEAYHQWAEQFSPSYICLGITSGINDYTVQALQRSGYEAYGQLLRRTPDV